MEAARAIDLLLRNHLLCWKFLIAPERRPYEKELSEIFLSSAQMQLSGNSHAPSKKILITGGGGFIGSHLLEFLLDRGDSVTVLDDFSTGCMANIADWLSHPGFSLIQSDVSVVCLFFSLFQVFAIEFRP